MVFITDTLTRQLLSKYKAFPVTPESTVCLGITETCTGTQKTVEHTVRITSDTKQRKVESMNQ